MPHNIFKIHRSMPVYNFHFQVPLTPDAEVFVLRDFFSK